jgi:AcrR family transcriptional regulator
MAISKRTDRSKRLILDAADSAFRERGFADATMEDIATGAGLTRKTVYNLFSSKEEIAQQIIARTEADDAGYRSRIADNERALSLLETILLDSAGWCLANPSLARLALSPDTRPSLEPPPERPSFQRIVRDVLVLGQNQGAIRRDEDPNFMALVLLGIYGQAMLTALSVNAFNEDEMKRIVRIVVEGIGPRPQAKAE